MKTTIMNKAIPLWFVILLTLLSIPGIWAALTVQNTTKTTIFGEVYTVTEDLSVVTQGVDISPSAKSAKVSSFPPILAMLFDRSFQFADRIVTSQ